MNSRDCFEIFGEACSFVIASEVKQSSSGTAMDCFVASLLAMTNVRAPPQIRSGNRMMKLSRFGILTLGRLCAFIGSSSGMSLLPAKR
jgi:hypothetical protein